VLLLFQSKAKIITYSECQFIALGLQHAMCLCHIVVPDRMYNNFNYLKKAQLSKKDIERKMSVLIFSTFVRNIFHSKNNSARYQQNCIFILI
jgi:hypothetical protein